MYLNLKLTYEKETMSDFLIFWGWQYRMQQLFHKVGFELAISFLLCPTFTLHKVKSYSYATWCLKGQGESSLHATL
jgi:hypothetical protein